MKRVLTVLMCFILTLSFCINTSALNWTYISRKGEVWHESDAGYEYVSSSLYNYLTNTLGLNNAATCAVIGNVYAECCFDYTMFGNYNGLCQWYKEDRWPTCVRMFGTSLDGQINFIGYELTQGAYQHVYKHLKNVPNTEEGVYDAENYFRLYYECCGEQAVARRQTAAMAFFNSFKGYEIPVSKIVEKEPVLSDSQLKYIFSEALKTIEESEERAVEQDLVSEYSIIPKEIIPKDLLISAYTEQISPVFSFSSVIFNLTLAIFNIIFIVSTLCVIVL